MAEQQEKFILNISNAPHVKTPDSITKIMWTVVLAMSPAFIYGIYLFGINAFILLTASVIAAVVAEAVTQYLLKKPITIKDGSAVVTGLLIGMNVPPGAPVWVVVLGSFFGIIIVKQLFGGLGFNIFNPALAARAFMVASWPVQMTTHWHKFSGVNVLSPDAINRIGLKKEAFDALTQATPLAVLKEGPQILQEYNISIQQLYDMIFSPQMLKSMAFGNIGGVIGETSAVLLLVGGIFLMFRRIITWHVPFSFIGTVGALAFAYYSFTGLPPAHLIAFSHVVSGGLFLGAFFMATDMVTSPVTPMGMIIFGMGCGIITFVIRIWGGFPEGVSYSILLMNAVVPLIDRYTRPRIFGR
jgi:electron transport complex protein RnfD